MEARKSLLGLNSDQFPSTATFVCRLNVIASYSRNGNEGIFQLWSSKQAFTSYLDPK